MAKDHDPLQLLSIESDVDGVNLHEQVYKALSQALIEGRIPPSRSLSLRGIAALLNVSAMPVRGAVTRLMAEGALELQKTNNRLRVPILDPSRLEQLTTARLWLEPELAARAALNTDKAFVERLKRDDEALMKALSLGDVAGYMQANQDFHFAIYEMARSALLMDMARSLWLKIGPFMRVVFGQLGTVQLPKDHHQDLINAFISKNAEGARASMHADVFEGTELLAKALIQEK
jgi:DNA-binding GntR family transcriptional regulator